MKKRMCMSLMLLATICMMAQDAIVKFNNPVPMPKNMKGKDWQVMNKFNDELIIYSFKEGKLNFACLDAFGNVKQQAEHKNTKYSLMNIFADNHEIAVLTYDSNIGGIQCNTYNISTFAPQKQKTLVEQRKDVFDSFFIRVSKNGQYIAILTNYIQQNIYHHKLYLFDREFNLLTACETLQQPEIKNIASFMEADMKVTDDGKVIIANFRTLLNNARRYDGDKSKLNFGKATYATADYAVQIGVDIITKDGQQHYDMDNHISGLVVRPSIMSYDDNSILIGIFTGNAHGQYAGSFALTDNYITLNGDLSTKTVVERGRITLPGAPWSCLMMYNNKPTRMGNVIKVADGSYIMPSDKNPREPYNRFEVNFNREFIWADADGSNLTFGSWGSMFVTKQPRFFGGFSIDGGMSVRFPYSGRYWMIDIPDSEVGNGVLRSCTKDGKMTQSTPDGFQNITVNSRIIPNGSGKFIVLNMGKQNKEPVFQTGSIEMNIQK